MKLERLSDRIWVYPYEEKRDRPNLSYIKGDHWSLAVDAGHSVDHVRDFYDALAEEGLPLPKLTVLTHWHWDHTFGIHAVHGMTLANPRTNKYLTDFAERIRKEGPKFFLEMDPSIQHEYEDGKPVIVVPASTTFSEELMLDLGNCTVKVFEAEAPHTDDSTLVYVPEDNVLILGDCTGGTFPDWKFDQELGNKLAETIKELNPEKCLPGHWSVLPTAVIIKELLEGDD